MKAITITTENKANNPQLFKGAVDSIKTFNSIPKVYYREANKPTYGYNFRTEWHEQDGFLNVVYETPFDPAIEKYVPANIFKDELNNRFVIPKVELTQEELDAKAQQEEDIDPYSSKQSTREIDGQTMRRRFFALIHRRVDNNQLTATRALKTSLYMSEGLQFLSWGEMEIAKNRFQNIDLSGETAANQTPIQEIIDLAIAKVQTYLDNE